MSRRYLLLVAAVLAGIGVVSVLARLPRGASQATAAVTPAPEVALSLAIDGGRISPAAASVPKGDTVRLTLANHDRVAHAVRLAGYESQVTVTIAAGGSWSGSFRAELPGEDFVWLVDGQPAGRLAVSGSHLEEGHR
jgi:endonuclease YncB( thermonuclease family)